MIGSILFTGEILCALVFFRHCIGLLWRGLVLDERDMTFDLTWAVYCVCFMLMFFLNRYFVALGSQ